MDSDEARQSQLRIVKISSRDVGTADANLAELAGTGKTFDFIQDQKLNIGHLLAQGSAWKSSP